MSSRRHLNPEEFGEFDPTTFKGYEKSEYNYGAYLTHDVRAGNRIDRHGYRSYSTSSNRLGQDDADLYESGGEPREHFSYHPYLKINQPHYEAKFVPNRRSNKN